MKTSLFKEALAAGDGIGGTSNRRWLRVRGGDGKTSLRGGYDIRYTHSRTRSSLGGPKTITQWFNTQAFSAPAAGYFSNEGTGGLAGPGVISFDMTPSKSFAVTEEDKIEFRAEFFNIFNRINFTSVPTMCGRMTGRRRSAHRLSWFFGISYQLCTAGGFAARR
jgi:hypothetical protein